MGGKFAYTLREGIGADLSGPNSLHKDSPVGSSLFYRGLSWGKILRGGVKTVTAVISGRPRHSAGACRILPLLLLLLPSLLLSFYGGRLCGQTFQRAAAVQQAVAKRLFARTCQHLDPAHPASLTLIGCAGWLAC